MLKPALLNVTLFATKLKTGLNRQKVSNKLIWDELIA